MRPSDSIATPSVRLIGGLFLVLGLCALRTDLARGDESGATGTAGVKTGLSAAPEFTVEGLDGKKYVLKELLARGPVLLDFWTT